MILFVLFIKSSFQDAFKCEREKLESLSGVKLVLELHPVKSQCMEKGGQPLHDEKNGHRATSEEGEHDSEREEASETSAGETEAHHHRP